LLTEPLTFHIVSRVKIAVTIPLRGGACERIVSASRTNRGESSLKYTRLKEQAADARSDLLRSPDGSALFCATA
jgi:hypothetical protein